MVRPVVFLDRDGTIIENREDYVRKKEHVKFIPGSIEGIKLLKEHDALVFIVTNQSVVGRGVIPKIAADHINHYINVMLEAEGVFIDGIYTCYHAPEEGCPCRKPFTGLLEQALSDHDIDIMEPQKRYVIGDNMTDVKCASLMHTKGILVRTGLGEMHERSTNVPMWLQIMGYMVYNDLKEAAKELVKDFDKK